MKTGLDGFAEYEVVELLLTLAIPRSDVKLLAKTLVQRFGSLRGILDAPIDELSAIKGVGTVTPVALRLIREAATLYLRQSAEEREFLGSRESLERFWRAKIGALPKEVFEVAYLDTGYRLIRNGVEHKEEGTIDRAAVYPREIVESALRRQAAAVVVAHNHPNGRLQPSEQDKVLNRGSGPRVRHREREGVRPSHRLSRRCLQLRTGGVALMIVMANARIGCCCTGPPRPTKPTRHLLFRTRESGEERDAQVSDPEAQISEKQYSRRYRMRSSQPALCRCHMATEMDDSSELPS